MNGFEIEHASSYLPQPLQDGRHGTRAKRSTSNLPFEQVRKRGQFAEERSSRRIAYRREISAPIWPKGRCARAVKKWGRWEEDSVQRHLLAVPATGATSTTTTRALEVEWSYGEHHERARRQRARRAQLARALDADRSWQCMVGEEPLISAEEMVKPPRRPVDDARRSDVLRLERGGHLLRRARCAKVALEPRHYGRFWVQSLGMCDWVWPNFVSRKHTAETGSTLPAPRPSTSREVLPGRHRPRPLLRGEHRAGS